MLVLPLLAGCIFPSPEDRDRQALGPEARGVEEGPLHRPNQPCLTCHGEDYHPGDAVFEVAGTVYLRASDGVGLEGARVHIVDDAGREVVATTNRAGNFMVRVGDEDEGGGEDEDEDEGAVSIPQHLDFPLRVSVSHGADEQEMRSVVHRDGSCASCHGDAAGADSVGKVYLLEEPAP